MKTGVSFSLFDGEELLERALEQIRKCGVEYVNIVWQTKSYFGQNAPGKIEDLLNGLKQKKLVDELYHYNPVYSGYRAFTKFAVSNAKKDETAKRNLGLQFAKKAECTHFMTMDVDEFYFENEFKKAVEFITKENIDYSAVPMYSYHIKPTFQVIDAYRNYFAPFLINIQKWPNAKFILRCKSFGGNIVDPTRRINFNRNTQKLHFFEKSEIAMHHMKTIRNDLVKKMVNSTAYKYASRKRITKRISNLRQCNPDTDENIKIVDNYFNIEVESNLNFDSNSDYRNIRRFELRVLLNEIRALFTNLLSSFKKDTI